MPHFVTDNFISAVVGALIGSLITACVLLYQTWTERNQTKRSIATALLWEMDDFYKSNVRNTFRALERADDPTQLGYYVRSPYKGFTVYEATADRVGLFRPATVQGIVLFYASARAYLNVIEDYGRAVEQVDAGRTDLRRIAVTLLVQVKKSSADMIPLIKTVVPLLAEEAGTTYEFESPERFPKKA